MVVEIEASAPPWVSLMIIGEFTVLCVPPNSA
jgi:hypothetical protein